MLSAFRQESQTPARIGIVRSQRGHIFSTPVLAPGPLAGPERGHEAGAILMRQA